MNSNSLFCNVLSLGKQGQDLNYYHGIGRVKNPTNPNIADMEELELSINSFLVHMVLFSSNGVAMLLITLCMILIHGKIAHISCFICIQNLLRCCWGHYNRGRWRVISAAQGKLFNFEYLMRLTLMQSMSALEFLIS